MRKSLLAALAAAAALSIPLAPVARADGSFFAADYSGDWLVRLRGLAVLPDEDLSADGIPGSNASISDSVVPELDITYFFTPNFAAELVLGVTPHDVTGRGALAGADIGSVWLLPPTLTAQYHVTGLGDLLGIPALNRLKPYVGAGVNYTMFFNEDAGQFAKIHYDNAFGAALQIGVDYEVGGGMYLNADVKYLMLNTDWKINGGAVRGDVDINPLLVGVGVGYRF